MGHQLNTVISVSMLARSLSLPWRGQDLNISEVCPFNAAVPGTLCFTKTQLENSLSTDVALIGPTGTDPGAGAIIEANNPRLEFARALNVLAATPGFIAAIRSAQVAKDAVVSPTAVLGRGVTIGPRSVIGHHVVIADDVHIGADCHIKSNTVIGEAGFGFERDEQGLPIRMLHLGNVVIGDRVEIGSLNTICRATLGTTIIEDDVKTDDHVHIAHNCRVRRGALLTACSELSGGVDVGAFAWIGPNTSIIQKVVIGEHAFLGIGSNVTKSVPPGATVAGNPARVLRKPD